MFVEESLWRSMREGFTVFRSKCSPNVVDFGLVFYQFGETIHFAYNCFSATDLKYEMHIFNGRRRPGALPPNLRQNQNQKDRRKTFQTKRILMLKANPNRKSESLTQNRSLRRTMKRQRKKPPAKNWNLIRMKRKLRKTLPKIMM